MRDTGSERERAGERVGEGERGQKKKKIYNKYIHNKMVAFTP